MYHPSRDTLDIMFESCLTYETGQLEPDDFPQDLRGSGTNLSVWILGKIHLLPNGLSALREDVHSRLWFTYRKGFQPIGDTSFTTDRGWGCMLRCGQMLLAETLMRHQLGRSWMLNENSRSPVYTKLLKMFEDKRHAMYSIHQIAQMGISEGKQVGQWFGPNTVAQVIRKLSAYDRWSDVRVHIAMDNQLIISDVESVATTHIEDLPDFLDTGERSTENRLDSWRPVLIVVPLRVGMNEVNEVYVSALKACFELEYSVGMIGGKPNQALYFIGYVGNEVVFLDPHVCQPCESLESIETFDDSSYHCQASGRLPILAMDPSVAVCFFCKEKSDFLQLCQELKDRVLSVSSNPLFEISEVRTHNSDELSFRTVSARTPSPYRSGDEDNAGRAVSDEDFELIE